MAGAVEGNRTIWPQAGQAYSLTPRWRRGVRHLGHGIGFAPTHAANSSWERRSPIEAGAVAVGGELGTVGVEGGVTERTVVGEPAPVRAEERRPHWGQTARLAVPVDWSGT